MINMHSKYDNIHENGMYYALIYINNHVFTSISYMLLELHGAQESNAYD